MAFSLPEFTHKRKTPDGAMDMEIVLHQGGTDPLRAEFFRHGPETHAGGQPLRFKKEQSGQFAAALDGQYLVIFNG